MPDTKIHHARISNIYTLPERICAYVITHTPDNVHVEKYVGASNNLRNRMYTHYKNIIHIDLYVVDNIHIAESLERILIELIKPATNKIIPLVYEWDKDLMKELLENDKMKSYIFSNNTYKIGYRYLKYIICDKIEHNRYKSIHLEDNIHLKISKIQIELEEIGIKKTLYQILDISIHHGIDSTFEFIKNSETSIDEN